MDLEKIRAEQGKALDICEKYLKIVDQPSPAPAQEIAKIRWDLSILLITHFSHKDKFIYAKFINHDNPDMQKLGKEMLDELHVIYDSLANSPKKWTPQVIENNWSEFCRNVKGLLPILVRHFEKEEHYLYPHIINGNIDISTPHPPSFNWARIGFELKDLITPK